MSIYAINQFSGYCHGDSFTTAGRSLQVLFSLTASINRILALRLSWYLNNLQLCYQNDTIKPQNLDFKQKVEELEEGPLKIII